MNMTTTAHQQKEQTAQLAWTGMIIAFFVIQAILWIVAISYTANDSSHVVLTDYEQKSLHWDEDQAIKRASAALGWKTDLKIDEQADIVGNRAVRLRLLDRGSQPIPGVGTIELVAFHRGQAAVVHQLKLQQTEPGTYLGTLQVRKSGRWQFSGTVRSGEQQFLLEEQQTIAVANSKR